jgi:hypothetical protein
MGEGVKSKIKPQISKTQIKNQIQQGCHPAGDPIFLSPYRGDEGSGGVEYVRRN